MKLSNLTLINWGILLEHTLLHLPIVTRFFQFQTPNNIRLKQRCFLRAHIIQSYFPFYTTRTTISLKLIGTNELLVFLLIKLGHTIGPYLTVPQSRLKSKSIQKIDFCIPCLAALLVALPRPDRQSRHMGRQPRSKAKQNGHLDDQ